MTNTQGNNPIQKKKTKKQQIKELVIARLQSIPDNVKISIG